MEDVSINRNERAHFSIDVFIAGIEKIIGAFYMEMGRLDIRLFIGGICGNSSVFMRLIYAKLHAVYVSIDPEKNLTMRGESVISTSETDVLVKAVTTDGEQGIVRRTYEFK